MIMLMSLKSAWVGNLLLVTSTDSPLFQESNFQQTQKFQKKNKEFLSHFIAWIAHDYGCNKPLNF